LIRKLISLRSVPGGFDGTTAGAGALGSEPSASPPIQEIAAGNGRAGLAAEFALHCLTLPKR